MAGPSEKRPVEERLQEGEKNVPEMTSLEKFLMNRPGDLRRTESSESILREAALKGDAEAMVQYGRLLERDRGGRISKIAEALKLYQKADELGNVKASLRTANILHQKAMNCRRGGAKKSVYSDLLRAQIYFRKAVLHGSVEAKTCYADFLLENSLVEAMHLYESTLEEDEENLPALYGLARLAINGTGGVPKDLERAKNLYESIRDLKFRCAKAMEGLESLVQKTNEEDEVKADQHAVVTRVRYQM